LTIECTEKFLQQSNLISKIKQILTTTQLNQHYLNLDLILENISLTNRKTIALLEQLKQLGIKLNLVCNDISYDNLKEIHNLPFNGLTLASNLIEQIVTSPEVLTPQNVSQPSAANNLSSHSFAQSEIAKIINLAHANKITVTAKEIKTQAQVNYLVSVGCDFGQGEFFSQPLDRESLEMFLVWRI
jgi:EAL domain-containing protein (putative c-di-GMP-specific phosphodiesterase class I)